MKPDPTSFETRESRAVPLREKLAYGCGAVADMIGFHGPMALANPIFNIVLGVSPTMIGVAKFICRAWDAFSDPWMGTISDRGWGRLGRRRPFLILGALTMALTFFLFCNVPRGLGEFGTFLFFTGTLLLFYTAYTIFTVPYHGLGYELADNHHDRTKVMAWRLGFNMIGTAIVNWLFVATQLAWFSSIMEGTYYVGAATGLVIIAFGIIPAYFVRERPWVKPKVSIKVTTSIKAAWANGPFVSLLFLALLQLSAGTVAGTVGEYVNYYYVFQGDLKAAAILAGTGATIGHALAVCSAFLWPILSKRYGKKEILIAAIAAKLLLNLSTYWLYTPEHPYLQLVYRALNQPLVFGFWLMVQSMIADTCDFDEWKHGTRREGVFGAFLTWFQKTGVSVAFVIGGLLVDLSGFNAKLGSHQLPQALALLRWIFVGLPIVAFAIALVVAWRYSLTATRLAQITTDLKQRHAAEHPL